jgi:uncharacterized protein
MTETAAAQTETNRDIITGYFDAWSRGIHPDEMFAPGLTWRIEGHSAAAGEYGSRQQFIDEMLSPFGARFSEAGPFRPVVRAIHADGDTVVVVFDGRGIATDGQPYENNYVWIMKLAGGRVVDGAAWFDSISFNDLWARVQPS